MQQENEDVLRGSRETSREPPVQQTSQLGVVEMDGRAGVRESTTRSWEAVEGKLRKHRVRTMSWSHWFVLWVRVHQLVWLDFLS